MLHTQDLQPVRVPEQLLPGGVPGSAVLVTGANQILGGGVLEAIPNSADFAVVECWGVSDLTEGHWMALNPAIRFHAVPAPLGDATRATLERFHADGARRIDGERARRSGVLDAVRALGESIPGATLNVAGMAARNGGQRGTGSQ